VSNADGLFDAPVITGFVPVGLLGRGGFAEVFLYRQSTPRRQVALKVLHTSDLGDKAIEQLTVEADTMAELSTHPHIATIYTSGLTDDGRPYLAMEYCPKPSLNIGLRTVRRTISEVLGIGVEIAGAVETAHRAGVLHRDIKPANILVTQYDNPVLTDFGIAVSVRQSTDQVEGLSVPWSPPEAFTQPPTAGPPSDVWGLAATVYSLLAGRAPFEVTGGDNTATVQMGRIERDVLPPVGRVDCPASLDRVLAVGMAKNPERRYASALVFGRALQRVQAELGIDPTRMVIRDDANHTMPSPVSDDDADEITLTRLRDPRLVDQPELTRQVEPAVLDGITGPTKQAAGLVEPDALAQPVEPAELDEPVGPGERVEPAEPTSQVEATGPTRKAEPGEQSEPPRTAGPGRRAGQVEQLGATSPTEPSGQIDATKQAEASAPAMLAADSKHPDETLLAQTRAAPPDRQLPKDDDAATNEPADTGPPGEGRDTPGPQPKRDAGPKPNRTLRRGLIAVTATLIAVVGGVFWAATPKSNSEPTLVAGTCLSVSPGELLTGPPEGWKSKEVDCAEPRAAVRLVVAGDCPGNSSCWALPSAEGDPLLFTPLPAEGVCYPTYTESSGKSRGIPEVWSPCGDFRRPQWPWGLPEDADNNAISGKRLTQSRIEKLVSDSVDCEAGQFHPDQATFDGKSYFACATIQ